MRDHFSRPLRDGNGALLAGASVRLLEPGSTVPLTEQIFVAKEGTEEHTNPWTVDNGVIDFYLKRSRMIRIGVLRSGVPDEIFFEDIEVGNVDLAREVMAFTVAGQVSVQTGNLRLYVEADGEIERIRASVGTPPVGGSIEIDVLLNGVSIFGADPKPVIADGTYTTYVDLTTPVVVASGDYLTVDILSTGVSTVGSNLVVQVREARY